MHSDASLALNIVYACLATPGVVDRFWNLESTKNLNRLSLLLKMNDVQ